MWQLRCKTSFCIYGKLYVICAATYVYDTLLCLWQLICYMCGNLCVRHILFSGNFYITSVTTSYKFFFGNSCAWHFFWSLWQLLCITKYDFMVNFFFFLTAWTKKCNFFIATLTLQMWQLMCRHLDNLCDSI